MVNAILQDKDRGVGDTKLEPVSPEKGAAAINFDARATREIYRTGPVG